MAEALGDVRTSLQRNLDTNRGGRAHTQLQRLAACIDHGVAEVQAAHHVVRQQVQEIERVAATLTCANGSATERQAQFTRLQEEFAGLDTPFYHHVAGVMASFATGLFVGGDTLPCLQDNLDLERWFRKPKGHERRIHGHRHAGVRIVQEGPTLLLALDAHVTHPEPFTANDLGPYQDASAPPCQVEALQRRKMMRKARSKKKKALAHSIGTPVLECFLAFYRLIVFFSVFLSVSWLTVSTMASSTTCSANNRNDQLANPLGGLPRRNAMTCASCSPSSRFGWGGV